MHTVHNARISLLSTALNNLALSIIVAGFIAPAAGGQLQVSGSIVTTLAWIGSGVILHECTQLGAWETAAMTWEQIIQWIVTPVVGSIVIGVGAVWLSKYIP